MVVIFVSRPKGFIESWTCDKTYLCVEVMNSRLDAAQRPKWRYWTSRLMLITASLAAARSVWCRLSTSLILIKGQFDADKKTFLCWWTDSAVMYGQFDADEQPIWCWWTWCSMLTNSKFDTTLFFATGKHSSVFIN